MTRPAMRFLLPHERWLVSWFTGRQRTHRTAPIVAMEQKYGPQGMVWMNASMANTPFFVIPTAASLIPTFADRTRTSPIALYPFAAGFLFLVLIVVRMLQASRAGRVFRRDGH
jgi:ABC-type branched-subunit amino acid transport system permease subunit